jgi:hypothetical protein
MRSVRYFSAMTILFSQISLRGIELPNRIMVAPMCQYSAENGSATAWHMVHLGSLALSGAGMLCIEATAVEPDGRITRGCLGLWSDANEAALAPIMAAIRKYSKIAAVAAEPTERAVRPGCDFRGALGARVKALGQDEDRTRGRGGRRPR